MLYDSKGNVIKLKSFNLDPTFFHLAPTSDIRVEEIIDKPYQFHAWTHACAWTIARNISQLPMCLVDKISGETIEDTKGIIKRLYRPNPYMTYTPFIQAIVLGLLIPYDDKDIAGQVFLTPRMSINKNSGKVNLLKGEIPDALLPYTNRVFSPIVSDKKGMGDLEGWRFQVQGMAATKLDYATNEIIRICLMNPYDWLNGLASYTPAKLAVLQDIKADLYNTSFFDNNATPAGILSTEMMLNDEQRREALRSWMEEYGGSQNAAKIAILQKGLKFERIALTQQDMQFAETKKNSLEQIIASFGLNKIALGMYEDINLATIREGRRLLWQDTYLPIAKTITEAINTQWVQNVYENAIIKFDTSSIEALKPDYTARVTAASQMVRDMAIPASVACRINEIPLTHEDIEMYPYLSERPILPANEASLQMAGIMPNTTAQKEEPLKAEEAKKSVVKSIFTTGQTDREKFLNEFIEKILVPGERAFQKAMDRFFISQRNRMQTKVDEWLKMQKSIPANTSDNEFLLDLPNENSALTAVFKPMVKDQLLLSTEEMKDELNGLISWTVDDTLISNYIAARKEEIALINTTTFTKAGEKISEAISESILSNETPQETAKRIKIAISDTVDLRRNQAKTIARTEIGIVTSKSRYDAFKTEGIEYWEWITAHDDKVRESHLMVDGSVRIIGNPFGNGLMYPLDTLAADPAEIINCRCVTVSSDGPERG